MMIAYRNRLAAFPALALAVMVAGTSVANAESITVRIKPGTSLRGINANFFGDNVGLQAGTLQVEFEDGDLLDAYCVDLYHTFSPGSSWDVEVEPISWLKGDGTNPPPVGRGGAVGWLYDQYAGSVSTNNERAGLQVAIWKMVYDGPSNLNFNSGNFILTGGSSQQLAIKSIAESYLGAYSPGDVAPAAWLRATSHPNGNRNQDLVTSVNAIPEPSAVVMAGGGLAVVIGATLLRRRRQSPMPVLGG